MEKTAPKPYIDIVDDIKATNFHEFCIILGINSENFTIFLESYPQIFIFAQKRSAS